MYPAMWLRQLTTSRWVSAPQFGGGEVKGLEFIGLTRTPNDLYRFKDMTRGSPEKVGS